MADAVACEWCGCATDGTNHKSLADCVEALKREVESLRRQLAAQAAGKDGKVEAPKRNGPAPV